MLHKDFYKDAGNTRNHSLKKNNEVINKFKCLPQTKTWFFST